MLTHQNNAKKSIYMSKQNNEKTNIIVKIM